MQQTRTALAVTLILLSALTANTQTIPLDTTVRTGTLPNGFTYYIRHNQEPKDRVYMYLVNNVGSVLEEDDQLGLAHFMEHMNFNGTTHFPKNELVSYLQKSGVRFGADLNAYTSFDETVYQLPLPANDPQILQNGFQIMRDWAQEATLDSTEIDKERGVVLEEQRLGRGADERMERIYFPVLLNNSRYAERLPIGKVDILKNFNHEAIIRFHHDWYRPDLQALIIVGDIDVNQTEEKIKTMFAGLKSPGREKPRIKYRAPLTGRNQFLAVTDREEATTSLGVLIKHTEQQLISETDYLRSMQTHLFNEMLTQRFAAVSETPGLPYVEAGAGISGFMGGLDAFNLDITLKKDRLREGFNLAWETIEQVKRFGFTEAELDRAKQDYLSGMESSFKEINKTASENFVGEYQRLFLNLEASPGIAWEYGFVKNHVTDITLSGINALVKEYIKDTNRDILITAPESEKNNLPDSATVTGWINSIREKNITAYKDEINNQPLLATEPAPGKIIKTKSIPSLGITELTLSNGLRVILKPTDFKNDEIRFAAFAPGGSSVYSDKEFENARNAAVIAGFGVGNFSSGQLRKRLSGKRVEVQPVVGEREQGIEGTATPKDIETAIQLIHLYFTAPRKDTALFNNIITGSKEELANRYNDPKNIFTDTVNQTLGNYNIRRSPPSVEELNKLDLEKMYSIYRERFRDASGFIFIFVGNLESDGIKPLLEKYLGSLPATHEKEKARDLGIHIPTGKIRRTVHAGTEDKATVKMVFSGDYNFSGKNNLRLQAIKEVLSIKIIEHLREDESEVYAPSVQVGFSKFPQARYAFTVAFGCAPANADHLMAAVEKEITALKINGPSTEDLDKFKAEYKRVHELQLTENKFWVSYLLSQYQNGEEPAPVSDKLKDLEKLTPSDVKKAAQQYLNGNNEIKFELLPVK